MSATAVEITIDRESAYPYLGLNGILYWIKIINPEVFLHLAAPLNGQAIQENVDAKSPLRQQAGTLLYDLRRLLTERQPVLEKPTRLPWPKHLGTSPKFITPKNENMQLMYACVLSPKNYLIQRDLGMNWAFFQKELHGAKIRSELKTIIWQHLTRKLLVEILELHRDHAHGDIKPENIVIEFQGDLKKALEDIGDLKKALEDIKDAHLFSSNLEVSLIDFDNAKPNDFPADSQGSHYPGNGNIEKHWMLSGKTYEERDLSAFIRIVLGVCLDSADYHDTTIFVTDIDSIDLHTYLDNINKNIQSNERNEPMRPLIESLEQLEKNGELNRERLLEVVGQSAIWDENTNTRLRGTQYCLTKELTPETLQAIEVCISLLLEEEEKAMQRGNNRPVYPDCVYDGPLVVQHLRERLPKSVFDQLNEALKNRILELENKATARSDWGRTQPQDSGAPEGGDLEPEDTQTPLVGHPPIALNASQKKVLCKTTTAVGLGTFGATVVATGIGAIAVWQTVAFVTLTAIATVCWPIAVAFSGAAVIATIVTYVILRSAALKQSRAEQATRSAAPSLTPMMADRRKKSYRAISKSVLANTRQQNGNKRNQPTVS